MMPSWPQLLILIAVVVLIFGTRRVRSLGSDLGEAIKGFKNAMREEDQPKSVAEQKTVNDDATEHKAE